MVDVFRNRSGLPSNFPDDEEVAKRLVGPTGIGAIRSWVTNNAPRSWEELIGGSRVPVSAPKVPARAPGVPADEAAYQRAKAAWPSINARAKEIRVAEEAAKKTATATKGGSKETSLDRVLRAIRDFDAQGGQGSEVRQEVIPGSYLSITVGKPGPNVGNRGGFRTPAQIREFLGKETTVTDKGDLRTITRNIPDRMVARRGIGGDAFGDNYLKSLFSVPMYTTGAVTGRPKVSKSWLEAMKAAGDYITGREQIGEQAKGRVEQAKGRKVGHILDALKTDILAGHLNLERAKMDITKPETRMKYLDVFAKALGEEKTVEDPITGEKTRTINPDYAGGAELLSIFEEYMKTGKWPDEAIKNKKSGTKVVRDESGKLVIQR